MPSTRSILFLGDSLTAGYALQPNQAYPALLQQKIDAIGLGYRCINAGRNGDTSTDGLHRLRNYLTPAPAVAMVALGANDLLRMQPMSLLEQNLRQMLAQLKAASPRVKLLLAGLRLPPTIMHPLAVQLADAVHGVFPRLALEANAVLVPDLLFEVAGIRHLNLPDALHPNVQGHKVMADTVWPYLRPLLQA